MENRPTTPNDEEPQGFVHDRFDQYIAENCRVVLYRIDAEFEVDIYLANGDAMSFDVPIKAIRSGRASATDHSSPNLRAARARK